LRRSSRLARAIGASLAVDGPIVIVLLVFVLNPVGD